MPPPIQRRGQDQIRFWREAAALPVVGGPIFDTRYGSDAGRSIKFIENFFRGFKHAPS